MNESAMKLSSETRSSRIPKNGVRAKPCKPYTVHVVRGGAAGTVGRTFTSKKAATEWMEANK